RDESICDSVRRSVHQANLVKIRACLAAGHYRPEHKKTDSPTQRQTCGSGRAREGLQSSPNKACGNENL
ncbi:hypothetical protein, partial [Pseudomonas shirazica]